MPTITLLYAGILGLMSIALSAFPGSMRGKVGVSVGDGGNPELLLAIRRHGNFTEFVPMAIILMALLELNGLGTLTMHIFGGVLVLARILHATGLKLDDITTLGRGLGAGGTALLTVVMSIWAITEFFI
ncbi:MAG: hypothetical protein GKR90_11865 [Pseudomonadales bacterium]|nr:hypothetical protein [Pseudomonadales bacterium]